MPSPVCWWSKIPKVEPAGRKQGDDGKEQAQTPRPLRAAEWGLGREMCKNNDAGAKSCFSVKLEF